MVQRQQVKVLNLEIQFGPEPSDGGSNLTSAMMNEWASKGWVIHTVLIPTMKLGKWYQRPSTFLLVVLTRNVEVATK